MLGKCFFILCAISLICAALCGNITELSNAVIDGAADSVEIVLTLCGNMCLWCGIMEMLKEAGVIGGLSRLLSPVLRHVFPDAWETGCGKQEITAAISANMLGIANAATPFAVEAMRRMQEMNPHKERATDDMVTLAVLGSASVNLLPTTLFALRRSAGSAAPYMIILPVWICSASCAIFGVFLSRTVAALGKAHKPREGDPSERRGGEDT